MSFENAAKELRELIGALKAPGDKVSLGFFLRRPQTLAALETAVQALQIVAKKKPFPSSVFGTAGSSPGRRGQIWTIDEDQRLTAAFDAGRSLEQLSKEFGRSASSISGRLVKLGRVSGWGD